MAETPLVMHYRRAVCSHYARFLIIALACGWSALAQGVALSLSSGSGTPGSFVSLNLSLTASTTQLPASTQWTLSYSTTDFLSARVAAGPAATAAYKTL